MTKLPINSSLGAFDGMENITFENVYSRACSNFISDQIIRCYN